jgi:hypothetical protein
MASLSYLKFTSPWGLAPARLLGRACVCQLPQWLLQNPFSLSGSLIKAQGAELSLVFK